MKIILTVYTIRLILHSIYGLTFSKLNVSLNLVEKNELFSNKKYKNLIDFESLVESYTKKIKILLQLLKLEMRPKNQ